jgi:parvulin-like peptidyl-prolyl isomerase
MLSRYVSILAVCALVDCANEPTREARVVLDVGERRVTMEELDRFVRASVQQESPIVSPEVMAALFEEFVEEQLLLQAADDSGVRADPQTLADRVEALRSRDRAPESDESQASAPSSEDEETVARDVEKQLRIQRLVETEVLSGITVSDEEIADYFERNHEDFVRPETVDVSQILVETEEQAKEVRETLVSAKVSFEDLARERSQGPEASSGGHLGAFAPGELPASFESQVFALAPGAISEVVSTDFGYHVFRVNRREGEKPLSLDDARESIRVDLLRRKSDEAMERYLDELERRYPVTVHQEKLSFAVAGRGAKEVMDLEKTR